MYIFIRKNCRKNLAAILDAMLELTVEKISKLHIIYMKRTFVAIKTKFTHTNLKDIFWYKKKTKTIKSFFFGSNLGCHIVSKLSYKLFTNNKVTCLCLEQLEFDAII